MNLFKFVSESDLDGSNERRPDSKRLCDLLRRRGLLRIYKNLELFLRADLPEDSGVFIVKLC